MAKTLLLPTPTCFSFLAPTLQFDLQVQGNKTAINKSYIS